MIQGPGSVDPSSPFPPMVYPLGMGRLPGIYALSSSLSSSRAATALGTY